MEKEILIDIAKLALQIWFANMRLASKSEDEIKELYLAEKESFESNRPELLPDP